MAIRTSYKHNKDGSITKTTTYRRKTILGNTRSESFSERIEPKQTRQKKSHKKLWITILVVGIVCIILDKLMTGA